MFAIRLQLQLHFYFPLRIIYIIISWTMIPWKWWIWVANQAARDRSEISWPGPKCFGEGANFAAKGLCGHRSKRLVALAQHGVARAQTLFAHAQVTFGRLLFPRPKRPFAPPQDDFQSFVPIRPLCKALQFAKFVFFFSRSLGVVFPHLPVGKKFVRFLPCMTCVEPTKTD